MDEPKARFAEIFFEVYEPLPRQGPGSRACAVRALDRCAELPRSPVVLDLGCGSGGQTLQLAELTGGTITAIDSHGPSVARLRATVRERRLSDRIDAIVGDIARPTQPPGSVDLIWSEGALYNVGVGEALRSYRPCLRPGGYFVFTEAVWRTADPPAEVKASFAEYAAMGAVADVLDRIAAGGYATVDHFTLPDQAWWEDFYTPMERRIEALRAKYEADPEALAVLDELAQEPAMHRKHADAYGYEFFITRPAKDSKKNEARPH